MSSIFEQLGYNYSPTSNEILTFDQKVLDTMNSMPELLSPWQYEDLRNEDTAISNYLVNPVSTITQLVYTTTGSISNVCSNIAELATISTTANAAYISANNFLYHTNRIAGITAIDANTVSLPHYDTAIGTGKSIMYIVYQSDGIQNNAPIMGSFTSLFIKDDLTLKYNAIAEYPNLIANSITVETIEEVVTITSNLTPTQINEIITNVGVLGTTMDTRRTHDETFFTNSNNILNEYNQMKKFKAPGSSETNIINDYIGTTRLKNNLANVA